MVLIPTFLFTESLISLISTYIFIFFQKSVTIDKYFLTVLNTIVIIEILRINTTECFGQMRAEQHRRSYSNIIIWD
jgi:hypothetical protein